MHPKYLRIVMKAIVAILCYILLDTKHDNGRYTRLVLNQIDERSSYEWTEEEVSEYKQNILDEIPRLNHPTLLEEAYYALGFLEALQYNFKSSNEYYFRALSFKTDNDRILGNIYKELSYNFLSLGDESEADYYFNLAQEIVQNTNDEWLKSNLYRRFSQGVIEYTPYTASVIPLLELIIEENLTQYNNSEAHQMLAIIYTLDGYYDKSIFHLLEAYKISIWDDDEEKQRQMIIELAQVYFLNEQYDQTIILLQDYISHVKDTDYRAYIPQLAECYRKIEGYDRAIQFLDENKSKLGSESTSFVEFWDAYCRAYIALNEGDMNHAAEMIERLDSVYQKNKVLQNANLSLRKDKIKLDYLAQLKVEIPDMIFQYEQLYTRIQNSYFDSTEKANLLKEVVNKSVELGNYELGYYYVDNQLNHYKDYEEYQSNININEIYDDVWQEVEHFNLRNTLKKQIYLIFSLPMIGYIIYLVFKKRYKYKKLAQLIKINQQYDSLTNTLTQAALYEKLQGDMEEGILMNFIVIRIKDLKLYNQKYGYLAGDKLLQESANIIKTVFQEDYVARQEGSHFIVVTKDIESICLLRLEYLQEKMKLKREIKFDYGVSSGKVSTRFQIDQKINESISKMELKDK